MTTLPRIRVGSRTASYFSAYTLGSDEAFRLDAVSWNQAVGADSDVYLPTLTVEDRNGDVIAECTTHGVIAPAAPNPVGFSYTGPAVFGDSFAFTPPDAYNGYGITDFGAAPIHSDMNAAWSQPPGERGDVAVTWLRSPGAVVTGNPVAHGLSFQSPTITATLTSVAAAGTYLLLAVSRIGTVEFFKRAFAGDVTVTDTVGGNVVDRSGNIGLGFSFTSIRSPLGFVTETTFMFYRIVNPLPIGAVITIVFNDATTTRLECNAHPVTGLTVGNPIGPNPGGFNTSGEQSQPTSPILFTDSGGFPPLEWVGGVLIAGTYTTPTQSTTQVMLERGDVENLKPTGIPGRVLPYYFQATLPELHVSPGCTLRAGAVNSLGEPRVTDNVTDFLIWGVDE